MEQIIRIEKGTSKQIFQPHEVNAAEEPVLRRKLQRKHMAAFFAKLEPVEISVKACGASPHWTRLLQSFGQRRSAERGVFGQNTRISHCKIESTRLHHFGLIMLHM